MENTTPFDSQEIKSAFDKYYPLLIEARKRLIATLVVFTGAGLFGFFFYEKIIKFLIDLLSLNGINIVFTSPFQFINLAITTSIVTGLVVSFPLLVFQAFFFLKPALKEKEYKMIIKYLPFAFLLFLAGFAFGFFIMKLQIRIFLDRAETIGIGNILDISSFLRTVLLTSVLMGISFEFPLLLLLLLRLGIVKYQKLSKLRLWVYLFSLIFVILLPVDSIIADFMLVLPLIALFELTLQISKFQKNKI